MSLNLHLVAIVCQFDFFCKLVFIFILFFFGNKSNEGETVYRVVACLVMHHWRICVIAFNILLMDFLDIIKVSLLFLACVLLEPHYVTRIIY